MQITVNLEDSLLKEAFQLTHLSTQEELVDLALRELVRSRRKKKPSRSGRTNSVY
jgi:Arc/MetJ family transcription regulator